MAFPPDDREVLCTLGKRVAEIAALPVHETRADMWRRCNRLDPVRPMVLVFPEGSWRELLPDSERVGDRYIVSRKPNPAMVAGLGGDPDHVRRSVRDDLERTRGCVVEFMLKDTHTCANEPRRMAEWVRIAKEEAERCAG